MTGVGTLGVSEENGFLGLFSIIGTIFLRRRCLRFLTMCLNSPDPEHSVLSARGNKLTIKTEFHGPYRSVMLCNDLDKLQGFKFSLRLTCADDLFQTLGHALTKQGTILRTCTTLGFSTSCLYLDFFRSFDNALNCFRLREGSSPF